MIYLVFLNALSPFIGVLVYIYAFLNFKKVSYVDLLLVFLIFTLIIYHLLICDTLFFADSFRFYFGTFIFYFFFKSSRIINFNKIFIIITIIIWIEFISINTLIDPWNLPNYPGIEQYSHFNPNIFFRRPYSFGCNASVSSSLYLVIFILTHNNFKNRNICILFFLTFILFQSGTGFFCFAIYLLCRKPSLLIFLISVLVLILTIESKFLFTKLSHDYISTLLFYKINQSLSLFDSYTFLDLCFGNSKQTDGLGGDSGWLYFILYYGIFGVFILFILIINNLNKKNTLPILLLIFSTFHYPTIFFFSGQFFFGYLLNYKRY